jgi:polyisoprenoid-binding protein YceI
METTQILTRTKWSLDPNHTHIGFKVKHLMVTNVRGVFNDYKGDVYTTGEDFSSAEIDLSIGAASVSTGEANRDNHLKSPDFFDTENFKDINFEGTSLQKKSGSEYILEGDLTLKGVTKKIKLEVEFNGIAKDQWGGKRAGFEVTGKISRKEFGLTWNAALETGGVVVGDEISVNCEIQLVQQSES